METKTYPSMIGRSCRIQAGGWWWEITGIKNETQYLGRHGACENAPIAVWEICEFAAVQNELITDRTMPDYVGKWITTQGEDPDIYYVVSVKNSLEYQVQMWDKKTQELGLSIYCFACHAINSILPAPQKKETKVDTDRYIVQGPHMGYVKFGVGYGIEWTNDPAKARQGTRLEADAIVAYLKLWSITANVLREELKRTWHSV